MHKEFIDAVLKYKGQIVNIQYYDSNNPAGPIINEYVVISDSYETHLKVISASNNTLLTRGLAIPLIEYVATPDGSEVVYNTNYDKPQTL